MNELQEFTSHGRTYRIDLLGVIHQTNARPFNYNGQYVQTYDTEAYRKGNDQLQALRLGFMIAAHGSVPNTICDVGYGNGAFLIAAGQLPMVRFGKDITGIAIDGIELYEDYYPADVYTFHDALEHIPDLSFIQNLKAKTVIISLPWCHYNSHGQDWFDNHYKHRKPDEHLHHFNNHSLGYFMQSSGWNTIATSNHEDIIRKSAHGLKNILTMAFRRR